MKWRTYGARKERTTNLKCLRAYLIWKVRKWKLILPRNLSTKSPESTHLFSNAGYSSFLITKILYIKNQITMPISGEPISASPRIEAARVEAGAEKQVNYNLS